MMSSSGSRSRKPLVALALTIVTLALTIVTLAAAAATASDQASPANPGGVVAPGVAATGSVAPALTLRNVAIIESQSYNAEHDMDAEWLAVATAMGHTAAIVGQSTLDDIANLAGTDILIVSSGLIDLPAPRVATITAFLMNQGQVYLQGEYICTFPNNLGFGTIVANLGGAYTPAGMLSGMLEPMAVLGTLASTPNALTTLPGFWYGCRGTGDATLQPFLEYNGDYFGFIFTPPNTAYGHVVYDTDQDWVRSASVSPASVDLMENILTFLADPTDVAVEGRRWGDVKSLYR